MIIRIFILLIIISGTFSDMQPESKALENVKVGDLDVCSNSNCSPLSGIYTELSGSRSLTKTVNFDNPFNEQPRVAAYLLSYETRMPMYNWARIKIFVRNVRVDAFEVQVEMWASSVPRTLSVQWIATTNPKIQLIEMQIHNLDDGARNEISLPKYNQPPFITAFFSSISMSLSAGLIVIQEQDRNYIQFQKRNYKCIGFFSKCEQVVKSILIIIERSEDLTISQQIKSAQNSGDQESKLIFPHDWLLYSPTIFESPLSVWNLVLRKSDFQSPNTQKFKIELPSLFFRQYQYEVIQAGYLKCLVENSHLVVDICRCKDGYFQKEGVNECESIIKYNNQFIGCPEPCSLCNSKGCTMCKDPLRIINSEGQCICRDPLIEVNNFKCGCPDGYYQTEDNQCLVCPQDCDGCDKSGCLSCRDPMQQIDSNQNCLCQEGTTYDEGICIVAGEQSSMPTLDDTQIYKDLLEKGEDGGESLGASFLKQLQMDISFKQVGKNQRLSFGIQDSTDQQFMQKIKKNMNLDIKHSNGTIVNIFPGQNSAIDVDSKGENNEILFDFKPLMDIKDIEIIATVYEDSNSTDRKPLLTYEIPLKILQKEDESESWIKNFFEEADTKVDSQMEQNSAQMQLLEIAKNSGVVSMIIKTSQPISQLMLLSYLQHQTSYNFQRAVAQWVFPVYLPSWEEYKLHPKNKQMIFFTYDVSHMLKMGERSEYYELQNYNILVTHFDMTLISSLLLLSFVSYGIFNFIGRRQANQPKQQPHFEDVLVIMSCKQLLLEQEIKNRFTPLVEKVTLLKTYEIPNQVWFFAIAVHEGRFAFHITNILLTFRYTSFNNTFEMLNNVYVYAWFFLWMFTQVYYFRSLNEVYQDMLEVQQYELEAGVLYEKKEDVMKLRTKLEAHYMSKYAYFLKDKLMETRMQIYQIYMFQYKKVLYGCILIFLYHEPLAQLIGLLIIQIAFTIIRTKYRSNIFIYEFVFKVIMEVVMIAILITKFSEYYCSSNLTDEYTEYDHRWKKSGYIAAFLEMLIIGVQNLEIIALILSTVYIAIKSPRANNQKSVKTSKTQSKRKVIQAESDNFTCFNQLAKTQQLFYLMTCVNQEEILIHENVELKFKRRELVYKIDIRENKVAEQEDEQRQSQSKQYYKLKIDKAQKRLLAQINEKKFMFDTSFLAHIKLGSFSNLISVQEKLSIYNLIEKFY